MEVTLVPFEEKHRKAVIDIFNHYVLEGFAAYPENPLPYEAFDLFRKMAAGYPAYVAETGDGTVAGFGFLHAHNAMSTFSHVAEISYFLSPEHCRMGIGTRLLERLLSEAPGKGIATVLASISAPNEASIAFHARHGFVECGRFRSVLRKKGTEVDVVWMQKMLG
jgi:L-amino acid N-acyltransferase YncA